ncbi:MAG: anthranilate phosphoribosyltransferase [Desulfonatronovibrionaceae bacterium]
MRINEVLQKIGTGTDLEYAESKTMFERFFAGELTPSQCGALLMGLTGKGETADELKAAVDSALDNARLIRGLDGVRIDTCGTGGDGQNSFNCSTAVAFFLADMGYKVVKHGNRAVSSTCGSADIIQALDLPILKDPDEIKGSLAATNFAFIFAPHFHPAFARVAPIRQELGIRTIFNLMGPLLNPARPTHQVLGVPKAGMAPLMAEVLRLSGLKAAVVHGAGGFDELTPCGVSEIHLVDRERTKKLDIDPATFGMDICRPRDLGCSDKQTAVAMQKEVLAGKGPGAVRDMVALNLGLALHLLDFDAGLENCIREARKTVENGLQNPIPSAA